MPNKLPAAALGSSFFWVPIGGSPAGVVEFKPNKGFAGVAAVADPDVFADPKSGADVDVVAAAGALVAGVVLVVPNKEVEVAFVAAGAAGVAVLDPNNEVLVPVLDAPPKRPPDCDVGVLDSGALLPKRPPDKALVVDVVFAALEVAVESVGLVFPNSPPEAG